MAENTSHTRAARRRRFRAGDRVIVRPPDEILRTLDAEGTLGGLPFMPEMLDWCGKLFRVESRVEKTCVDVPTAYANRRFAADDVVVLEGSRCDGSGHDGCKRGCKIFWKEAWLKPADGLDTPLTTSAAGLDRLRRRLKTKSDENRYFCQSTQLLDATDAAPRNRRIWMLRVLVHEVWYGDRSASEMLKLLARWSRQRVSRRVHGEASLRGPHERTPVTSLGLRPGDVVRVKSREEIRATLDSRRENRGLRICEEMTRCCGARAEVDYVVDRIIDERTGQMRQLRNTVTLRNLRSPELARDPECMCADQVGDCPRAELMYWREAWLERADFPPERDNPTSAAALRPDSALLDPGEAPSSTLDRQRVSAQPSHSTGLDSAN